MDNIGDLKALESTRSKILNSYLNTIENSFRDNRSQLKLINYGTGSGKTHQLFQSIYQTIEKYSNIQVIGVYIAPLREHLQVPHLLISQYPDIPVYKINSLKMRMTDEYIKKYKSSINLILKDKKIWQFDPKIFTQQQVQEHQKKFKQAANVIRKIEYIKKAGFGDEEFKEAEIIKATRELDNLIKGFLEFVIKCEVDRKNCSSECLELLKIFFPLHILGNKSGIVMLSYDKFETKISYFIHNERTWVKKSNYLDRYIIDDINKSKKFIIALDEQEDGYQIMLDKKIDIISPQTLAINNALSSIDREFSLLFSDKQSDTIDFLDFIDKNKEAFDDFREYFGKDKPLNPQFQKFAITYQRLIAIEGNSITFLHQVIALRKQIEKSMAEITGILGDYDEENPIELNFEMLARVFSKFENNRSLLISHKLYNKISDELTNIFSYNNLYIYNIEPLKKIFLTRPSGGHVHITEEKSSDNTSVAELIYTILTVRSLIETIKKNLNNVLDAEDSQSRSLDIWSQQIAKLQNTSEDNTSQNKIFKYLNRIYVYESYKSLMNIKEISRYSKNKLIDDILREVSIGSTAIFTSPEHKIKSMLSSNSNAIFLISATGGIFGDLSTSYDLRYLEDSLRNESGQSSFKAMDEEEISIAEEIRDRRQAQREVTVSFFKEHLSSFPNQETQEVVKEFEQKVLAKFIEDIKNSTKWFGNYKIQELQNFVRLLFYLFEDKTIQETIAFTQTLGWISKLIKYCDNIHHLNFSFKISSEHPSIYYFKIEHSKFHSKIRIKVILYAASFNKEYYDPKTTKTYIDELVEEKGQKIFFVSAYQSAAKGLNPIIKTNNGDEKDFDSLALLMDRYYTPMSPSQSKSTNDEKSTTRYHFALMKSIVNLGDSNLEIKDFNQYLSRPEASAFREQQHQILLGKEVLQAIGRSERRDFVNQTMKIFVNEETRKNLVNFYRYLEREEPNEIRKFSVNNHNLYLSVCEEEKKRSINNYEDHVYNEIDADICFQSFRKKMLEEIDLFHQTKDTWAIAKAWEALRDPIVFQFPEKYLKKLRDSNLFSDDFISSLFYHNPEQQEFTPYLASASEDSKKFQIISDSINGEKIYPYQQRLHPEFFKINTQGYDLEGNPIASVNSSSDLIYKLCNKLIPDSEVFNTYIPRPRFFYDVLYPSLAENFVERWIQDAIFQSKNWKAIKDIYDFEQLLDFQKYNKLYEKFDLYYFKGKTLFCIDIKAWSIPSGNRLSTKTVTKSQNKLDTITVDYPEFSNVKGLLLNLHANKEKSHKYSSNLSSGNLIYSNNYNCPAESNILKDFLFSKGK